MSADFHFAWPAVFLLLPLPWLVARFARPLPPPGCLRLPAAHPATHLATAAPASGAWLSALAWLTWLLLLGAAARPQMPDSAAALPVSGRTLMLAVDLSASMATRDLSLGGQPIDRLGAARALAGEFLARRTGDRVGLVVFGKQAYVHVPPTFDLRALGNALDTVVVGLAGDATALGDAIGLATKQLRDLPDAAKVLVLLTDGASTAGTLPPQRAAWLAQRAGVRIHAVGIGAAAPGGNPAFALDEPLLLSLAAQTGGYFQRATDATALAEFFRRIDALESVADDDVTRRQALELFPFPLILAAALAAALAWHAWDSQRHERNPWRDVVDAGLLPHVLAPAAASRRGGWLPWLALALVASGVLTMHGLTAPGLSSSPSYRASALRVIVADLSSGPHDAALRARLLALLDALPPGETALIAYAGDAYLVVPPTTDARNIAALVPELAATIMPLPGRRAERAHALAADLLAHHPARERAVFWLDGQPDEIGRLPPLPDARRFLLDLRAEGHDAAAMAAMVATLATDSGWRLDARPASSASTLAALALLALLPLAALGFRRGLFGVLLVPLLFAGEIQPARAAEPDAPWQAVAHYRAGRYDEALRLLEHHDDAVSLYNRGNALARLGRYAEAEAAYEASLQKRPGNADALFNRELMRRLRMPLPPDKTAPPPPATADPAPAEAERAAEQWLRGIPDDPAGLLRAKLRLEHQRRLARERPVP